MPLLLFRLRFVLLLFLGAPLPLLADLQLTFEVEQETIKPAHPPKDDESTVTKRVVVTAVLGSDTLYRTDDAGSVYIDFPGRRFYQISKADRSFTNSSLYANVGFRAAELRNRAMLAGALAAAGMQVENPMDPVLAENLLSLRSAGSASLIPNNAADQSSYAHGNKPLASYTHAGFELTESEAAQFARFLRYNYAAHPDILAALQTRRIVPQKLSVTHHDVAVRHFRLTLLKAERLTASVSLASVLDGLKEQPAGSPELSAALALTPADFKTKNAGRRQLAIAAAKSKAYLDSLLLFLEGTLSTGEPLPGDFSIYKTAIEGDPDCRTFFSTRRPNSKEATERAVETLLSLEAKTIHGRPVLKILRANLLTQLGKHAESHALFHAALKESPCIIGAWRDLGYYYYNTYQMDIAWQWWDAARRLIPAGQQCKPVDDLERKLLSEHPEFF